MSRQTKDSVLLLKVETTKGVDAAPTGATDAMLVSNIDITPLEATNVDRELIRSYYGASEQLVGTANVRISFRMEFSRANVAGTTMRWDNALRCCMFARVAGSSPTRSEYNPVSNAGDTATIYYYDDGVLHKLLGAMGNAEFSFGIGERPTIQYTFWGIDGGLATAANVVPVYAPVFRTPQVVTDQNSGGVFVGSTYAAGAITGGTEYPGLGIQSLNLGNSVQYMPELGGDEIDVNDRSVTGSVAFNLTPAQEITFMNRVRNNQLLSMSWLHHSDGSGGFLLGVFMPAVQFINPSKIDRNGRRYIGFDFRAVPVNGNDELMFWAL